MSIKEKWSELFNGSERGWLGGIEGPYWKGMRIVTLSVIVAFLGGLIMVLGAQTIGKWLVISGIFGAALGIVYHFLLMLLWYIRDKK